ncbi:hypothetical protein SPBR_04215 [Sporothrix brasiliensis 5110]|uniref:Uncharacterized protein n=1 Tax=Sporothrix brasiliensis 5110 TaxID=1398154 RepID=A0A0C2J3L9_9PEZI|nr:uncharacterized protein SPBR_04215 [Sporothrix brasiliensis 5110]KIH93620.1 hypothetical protein SPBR_04215 [Sporothrix brasiliensis 5110]
MDDKHGSQEVSGTEPLPADDEQSPVHPETRKRQQDDDDGGGGAEWQINRARTAYLASKPTRLTRKNLALFDSKGAAKKTRTHCESDNSTSTKTLSTTASGFAIQARQNGILDPLDSKPPENLEDMRKRLAEPRSTASPPESEYEDYVHTVGEAPNEATMVGEMLPLLKKYPKGYKRALNQPFTAFPRGVGLNNGLSAPQPDYVEGLGMEEYRPFPVDKYVDGAVLYKDNPRSVTLPHLAGEWKGAGGDMREAALQSGYDGAALVYARNQALAYQGQSDPPGHASITTFTTNGTQLNFYAHYATLGEDGALEYHQYPVSSTSLVNSHEEHKKGRKGLRNEQDHARTLSYELRDQLKEHDKKKRSGGLQPLAEGLVPSLPEPTGEPHDGHVDDDQGDGDYEMDEQQPTYQPTPPISSKHKNSKTHSHSSHSSHSSHASRHLQHSRHLHKTTHSSKDPAAAHSSINNGSQKRKAPPSRGSQSDSSHRSKHENDWTKHETGRLYRNHPDGTITWREDDENDDND